MNSDAPASPCPKCGGERRIGRSGFTKKGNVQFRPICLPCHRVSGAKHRLKYGGAANRNRVWEQTNRAAALAHKNVEGRLRRGTLVKQPCERCGATDLIHAHHDDYSKPAVVIWLCPLHHKERHRELQFREAAE